MRNLIFTILLMTILCACGNNDEPKPEPDRAQESPIGSWTNDSLGAEYYKMIENDSYTIEINKRGKRVFNIQDTVKSGIRKMMLDYGESNNININSIYVNNVIQFDDTYYVFVALGKYDYYAESMKRIYQYKNGSLKKIEYLHKRSSLNEINPDFMDHWYENSILITQSLDGLYQRSRGHARILDSELNTMADIPEWHEYFNVIDFFYFITISRNVITCFDVRDYDNEWNRFKQVWEYEYLESERDYKLEDYSYEVSEDILHVTLNVVYIDGERETIRVTLNKKTGEALN